MKHTRSLYTYISLACILVLLTLFATVHVGAQTRDVPSGSNESARGTMREERRMALTQNIQDRLVNLAHNVTDRLDAATTRMANIIGRLYTRIEKLRALGVDTSVAETKLKEATKKLNKTSDDLAAIGSIRNVVSSDSPREAFVSVRAQFVNVRTSLLEIHALLRETVALLKEATRKAESERGVSSAVTNENSSQDIVSDPQ